MLRFSPLAWLKMWLLTNACNIEVSGMGLLSARDTCFVEDIFVVKQKCSPTYTDQDQDELAALYESLAARGIDGKRLRVWWHSHVDMVATPSGTDTNTANVMANGGFIWMVITSKKGVRAALNVGSAIPDGGLFVGLEQYDPYTHDNLDSPFRTKRLGTAYTSVLDAVATAPISWGDLSAWVEESKAKVSPITPAATPKQYPAYPVTDIDWVGKGKQQHLQQAVAQTATPPATAAQSKPAAPSTPVQSPARYPVQDNRKQPDYAAVLRELTAVNAVPESLATVMDVSVPANQRVIRKLAEVCLD